VGLEEQLESGVVAEHVAHLHSQPTLLCLQTHQREFAGFQRAGFVQMDVLSRSQGAQCCGAGLADGGFHQNGLQPVLSKQLRLAHPGDSFVGGTHGALGTADAHHLVKLGQPAHRLHLA